MKLIELEVGSIYKCVLSNRDVLVQSIDEKESNVLGTKSEWVEVWVKSYNKITGDYETFTVEDHQLIIL